MQIRSDRTGRIAEKNILYGLSRNCRRIRQRLKDIVLQCFMRERGNDMTRDADQNNKMRTYRKIQNNRKLQMWLLPSLGHRYPPQNNVNKIAIKQPRARHRNGPIFKTC